MQAIKNGLKTIIRTPGTSLLFVLIMSVLSVLLAVSFCVFSAVRGYLRDADGYFHTVAELEFMGESYPSEDHFEHGLPEALADNAETISRLLAHDAVISFKPNANRAALVHGLHRKDSSVALNKAAVASFYITGYDEQTALYTAIVSKTYYAQKNYDEKLVNIRLDGEGELEIKKKYVMSGVFSNRLGGNLVGFAQKEISFTEKGESFITPAFELIETNELPEDNAFMRLARRWELINNACRVTVTNAIEDELPFHQQQLKLKSGRFFTASEYESGAKAAIISDAVSYGAGELKVGDRVRLSVFSFTGSADEAEFTSLDEDEYEIVGIFAEHPTYPNRIYIPGEAEQALRSVTGSSIGFFRLKNDRASAFLREAEKLGESGFRVCAYDQGYSAATEPMREMMLISIIFLVVCVLLAAAALVLQSHVFVSKRSESAQTMLLLGTSKGHILIYFLSAALLIAALAGCIGVFVAGRLESRVFDVMRSFASQFEQQETKFSATGLSLVRTLDFAPKTGKAPYIAAALALVLGAAVSTLAFALSAARDSGKKRSKSKKTEKLASGSRLRGGTSRLSGRLKYALLSLRRSPARSLAMLLVAFFAALFFSRLTASLAGYRYQLESYKRGAVIKGYATDLYGRRLEGFLFKPMSPYLLASSGEVKDMNLTIELGNLSVVGVAITKDGEENRELAFDEPKDTMRLELLQISMMGDLKWVAASSVQGCPAFHFKSAKDIRFLEGYSERNFMVMSNACALSEDLMEEHGIELGDAVMFQALVRDSDGKGDWDIGRIILKVIAAYSSNSTKKTVFSPLADWYVISQSYDPENPGPNPYYQFDNYYRFEPTPIDPTEAGTMDEEVLWRLDTYANSPDSEEMTLADGTKVTIYPRKPSFSSVLFTVKDNLRLDEARAALEEAGYAPVGTYERTKPYAIIDDEMYLNTTRSMQRQIQYVSVLYTALYVLAGVIGAALAWLLAASRRKEIALMRALGTPNFRIILNFLFEHALLCLVGLAIGLGAVTLIFGLQERFCYMLCIAFFSLWCISTMLCLAFGLAKKTQGEIE
ncbi:MAG: ABC transporter permease [Clostridia bacterium]|nr:ABC transporter permease [Clostridia bacterium]